MIIGRSTFKLSRVYMHRCKVYCTCYMYMYVFQKCVGVDVCLKTTAVHSSSAPSMPSLLEQSCVVATSGFVLSRCSVCYFAVYSVGGKLSDIQKLILSHNKKGLTSCKGDGVT